MGSRLQFRLKGGIIISYALLAAFPALAQQKQLQRVEVMSVQHVEHAPKLVLSGSVAPRVQLDLGFRVAGLVVERLTDVGDHVQEGDVLARLNGVEQQASLRAAEASLAAALVVQHEAQLQFQRQEQLLQKGLTTRGQFEQVEQQLKDADASVAAAESQLENARNDLENVELIAPFDGLITARQIEVGQIVDVGAPILSIAKDGLREAVFDLNDTIIDKLSPGSPVEVSLLTDPSVSSSGSIHEVAPVIDLTTGTIRVKVDLPGASNVLPLGSAISGQFGLEPSPAIELPASALVSLGGAPAIWRLDRSGSVQPVPVKIIAYLPDRMVVEPTLDAGETVVVSGAHLLHDGQQVSPFF